MIRTFRPWQIFERLGEDNELELRIPTIPGVESRTVFMLETALLVAAARIVNVRSILEIGTCMGYTAMHLAMNTNASYITAIDVAPYEPQAWEKEGHLKHGSIGLWKGTFQDYAAQFDGQVDFIFIDASHEYADVKADTATALHFQPRLIAWHDFSNPCEPGVTKFLGEFARDHNLIHVQDSWLAFWFREDLQ